jgi:hypothetical protein
MAAKLMAVISILVLAFHFLILFQIIPFAIVWAGKLKTTEEMYFFETLSIGLNVILLLTVLQKSQLIKLIWSQKSTNIILWTFVVIFLLNTVGNLFSKSMLELVLGTSLTAISAILCWISVRK